MSQSQPHESVVLGYIEYSTNEEEKTANLTRYQISTPEIIIPCSIKHKSKEYMVTRISHEALKYFNSRSVLFEPNSELRTIEKDAFYCSFIESIKIPASVVELKDGWCCETKKLIHVDVGT